MERKKNRDYNMRIERKCSGICILRKKLGCDGFFLYFRSPGDDRRANIFISNTSRVYLQPSMKHDKFQLY